MKINREFVDISARMSERKKLDPFQSELRQTIKQRSQRGLNPQIAYDTESEYDDYSDDGFDDDSTDDGNTKITADHNRFVIKEIYIMIHSD